MPTLKIAISPCPNDTFIFENIYNGKVQLTDIAFDFTFHDIDVLNKIAQTGECDIVKISFANYKNIKDDYVMLNSGGALGYGVGPLLVRRESSQNLDLDEIQVAIPGLNTTANFLLKYFYKEIKDHQKIIMPFDEIEAWTLSDDNRLGLLIHEGRFTYKDKGLALLNDLGQLWEKSENLPIPLGCIVAKKSLGQDLILKIEKAITASITNYDADEKPIISDFIRSHAQEMSEHVIRQHIDLYVNDFSKDMGEHGKSTWAKMESML